MTVCDAQVTSGTPLVTSGPSLVTSGTPLVTSRTLLVMSGTSVMMSGPASVTSGTPSVTSGPSLMTSGASLVMSEPSLVTSGPVSVTSGTPVVTSETPLVTSGTPLVTSEPPLVTSGPPPAPLGDPPRRPLLRAPRFTPGPAHLRIYQSLAEGDADVTGPVGDVSAEGGGAPLPPEAASPNGGARRPFPNHLALPRFGDVTKEGADVTKEGGDVTKEGADVIGDMARVYSLLSRARVQLHSIDRCRWHPPWWQREMGPKSWRRADGGPGDPQAPPAGGRCSRSALAQARTPEVEPRRSRSPPQPPRVSVSLIASMPIPIPARSRFYPGVSGAASLYIHLLHPIPHIPYPYPISATPLPAAAPFPRSEATPPAGRFPRSEATPPAVARKNRQARCGRCRGCRRAQDCAACANCRDKPKFGGPNTKKQCCVYRKCDKIEARKMERWRGKVAAPPVAPPGTRRTPGTPSRTRGGPSPRGAAAGGGRGSPRSPGPPQPPPPPAPIREAPPPPLSEGDSGGGRERPPPGGPGPPPAPQSPPPAPAAAAGAAPAPTGVGPPRRPGPPHNGWSGKGRSSDGVHRVRVDFKEDSALDNVWLLGGLSIVSSVPISASPRVPALCSKGQHQAAPVPGLLSALPWLLPGPRGAPGPGAGRGLELPPVPELPRVREEGPGGQAPPRVLPLPPLLPPPLPGAQRPPPAPRGTAWLCWGCSRCRRCGATPGWGGDPEWVPQDGLCPPCARLGRCCPLCTHWGGEEEERGEGEEPPPPRCPQCRRRLPAPSTHEAEEALGAVAGGALQGALWRVLGGLLRSPHGPHLSHCHQCPPGGGVKLHPGPCDLGAIGELLEGGHYGSVQDFSQDVIGVLLRGGAPMGGSPTSDSARELFIQLMLGAFPCFDIRDPKRWRPPGDGDPDRLPHAVLPPSPDHTYAQWRPEPPLPPPEEGAEPTVPNGGGEDDRQCALCLQCGDAPCQDEGRLLYIGQNEWTHVNCALWSAEVFEEGDGTLRNVHAAVARGRQMRCEHCGRPGATVGCCLAACLANYHFMCARRRRAAFQRDKRVFCQRHTRLRDGSELVQDEGFAVLRRVLVDFGGLSLKRKFLGGLEPEAVHMMIGSIRIDSLGALTELSERDGRLFPVGYQCWRLYWSTRDARRRCWYRCRILEQAPGGEGGARPRPPDINRTIAHGATPGSPPSPIAGGAPEGAWSAPTPRPRGPPGFSPTRRPPAGASSRPLPSPGSAPPVPRHILTVGDPEFPPPRRTRRTLAPMGAPPRWPNGAPNGAASAVGQDPMAPNGAPNGPTSTSRPSSPMEPPAPNGPRSPMKPPAPNEPPSSMGHPSPNGPTPSPLHPMGPTSANGPPLALTDLLDPSGAPMGDSSEDEDVGAASTHRGTHRGAHRDPYVHFSRTVVTRAPPSPCAPPLPHIDQLDGVDDGDKGQGGRAPMGAGPMGAAPTEDLPSDIVDFVLKSMAANGTQGVNGDGGTQWVPTKGDGGGTRGHDAHSTHRDSTHQRDAHSTHRDSPHGDAPNRCVAHEAAAARPNGTHGCGAAVGDRWVPPWPPKRPGAAVGAGAPKRARLEPIGDNGDGAEEKMDARAMGDPEALREVMDVKEEPEELSDSGSFGSPPPSDAPLDPPWAACTGGSSEDEAPESPPQEGPPPPGRPHLCFEISSEDGLRVTAATIEGAWGAVIEKVQEARANARLKQLSFAGMSGLRVLGMHHDAVVFLLEQLPGAGSCSRYRFRYHPRRERDPPHSPPQNPSGCARAELYLRKCTFDMFSFLASQHRTLPEGPPPREEEEDEVQLKPTRRATSLELPMAMRFRHLKRTAKEAVGVYRSAIHGRGLFCKRNIEAGEMVIEYSGIVVRSVLTDKREKFYDSKGIGCYMFRMDAAEVVDATMHGSAARFINHSCEPNCYSRVIQVEGHKHIVIFALRRILRGEELTYDYKFPIEEPAAKLPCNCGAKRCRRFLN
ncbi:histone-lysine N-methyltransferase 2B [Guaruba guarouba]